MLELLFPLRSLPDSLGCFQCQSSRSQRLSHLIVEFDGEQPALFLLNLNSPPRQNLQTAIRESQCLFGVFVFSDIIRHRNPTHDRPVLASDRENFFPHPTDLSIGSDNSITHMHPSVGWTGDCLDDVFAILRMDRLTPAQGIFIQTFAV